MGNANYLLFVFALLLAYAAFDLRRALKTGRVPRRGSGGIATRAYQPRLYWRHVGQVWGMLLLCAAAVIATILWPGVFG
jgi:hypothetical protein